MSLLLNGLAWRRHCRLFLPMFLQLRLIQERSDDGPYVAHELLAQFLGYANAVEVLLVLRTIRNGVCLTGILHLMRLQVDAAKIAATAAPVSAIRPVDALGTSYLRRGIASGAACPFGTGLTSAALIDDSLCTMEANQEYRLTGTSVSSATVEDIELSVSDSGITRKVLRAKVVRNARDANNPVEVAIVHQRRARAGDPWEDLGGPGLGALKAGEASKMQLDTDQTRALFEHLKNLYDVGTDGIRPGKVVLAVADEEEVLRADSGRARIIKKLLEADFGAEVWEALVEESPDLATKLSLARVYGLRREVVDEFEASLGQELGEEFWQKLLERNRWIFGNSYIGRVGERRIDIRSTLDHPLIAEDGCLDIVEIKKPELPFWAVTRKGEEFLYRDKYLIPHHELAGAIAQAQNYIFEVEREVDSRSWADAHDGVVPVKPRCLVVHGRSAGWGEDEIRALRLLNDSLHGVSVITFDHLLARARQTLEVFKPE